MPKVVFTIPAQRLEVDVDPERIQQWHGMGIPQRTEDAEALLWEHSEQLNWDYEIR